MSKCFVIQPFDKGKFDKRFDDVFAPAIRNAGLEPYRIDQDPSVEVPIEDIEKGIARATICVAEITLDNPNVWFELGYALAAGRSVIMVCDDARTSFPFDVQHRSIITYSTESSSDFEKFGAALTERLSAVLKRQEKLDSVSRIDPTSQLHGLNQHHVATLVSVAQQLNSTSDSVSVYLVREAMEHAGFTDIATVLGLAALTKQGMLELVEERDYDGMPYDAYRVTEIGFGWLTENEDKLILISEPNETPSDEIPF